MKTRTSIFLFIIAVLILVGIFFVSKQVISSADGGIVRAKVVNPKSTVETETEVTSGNVATQFQNFDTFIDLYPSETLISSIAIDFNADAYDDEVNIVRRAGEKFFSIVPGIYNPETSKYDRLESIPTKVSNTKTSSITGMDMIGDHKNALVYQGVDEDENSVMQIFMYIPGEDGNRFINIGDFVSDGTIFVQQIERDDSYQLSMARGDSYSVWVYKSEVDEQNPSSNKALNQIQQEYKWNLMTMRYELVQEIKVAASRLAAAELSKIQDGTVESFAAFLDGLWYKTENTDSDMRYFYFDYKNGEIIQFYGKIQEIYLWEVSRLRHNGIYISTVNADIANLHRRLDISLLGVDQIRITPRDDVNLIIKEDDIWVGVYKKLSLQSTFEEQNQDESKDVFRQELEKGSYWTSSDESMKISFVDDVYTITKEDYEEIGVYSFLTTGSYNVIQLRSNINDSALKTTYSMEFGTKTVPVRGSKKEKTVIDYDTITLTPVRITPTDSYSVEGEILTFTRTILDS